MDTRKGVFLLAAGGLALSLANTSADAKTKVQGNVVPQNIGGACSGPCYTLPSDKFGKFAVKESTNAGSGGVEMQLKLKGVDCPAIDVGGDPGKCNDTNHVLELNTDFGGLQTTVGVLYDLDGGKSGFQASGGKNKVTGAEVFGSLVGFVQGQFLGIGILRTRGPGGNPADCLVAPLVGMQECNDGERYGISGILASDAPGTAPPPCVDDDDCSLTQDCSGGNCIAEPCTQDSDCDEFAGGEVACNETTMTCCLHNLDTDPNCDVD